MSEENVELAERAAEMFNNRNLHGFLALMAPDVRFQPQLGPSSDGHDGIRRLWDSLIEGGDLTVEVVDVRDLGGDSVLAAVREHGRSTATGMSFHQTVWVPSSWRQGECVWWGVFFGEQDAIAAAGVGNSALDKSRPKQGAPADAGQSWGAACLTASHCGRYSLARQVRVREVRSIASAASGDAS